MPVEYYPKKYTLTINDHNIYVQEESISIQYNFIEITLFSNRPINISVSEDKSITINDLPISIMFFLDNGLDKHSPLILHGRLIDNLPILSLLSVNKIIGKDTIELNLVINSNFKIGKIIIPIIDPVLQALSMPCTVDFIGEIETREKPKMITYPYKVTSGKVNIPKTIDMSTVI